MDFIARSEEACHWTQCSHYFGYLGKRTFIKACLNLTASMSLSPVILLPAQGAITFFGPSKELPRLYRDCHG